MFKKDIRYGFESLKLSFQANGISALVLLFSIIYENTLFPFVQVFLLARLLDSLAEFSNLSFSGIAWIIAIYLIGAIIKLILVSYRDSRQSYQEIKTDSFLDLKINKKLSELDSATFEKPSFQSLIAQIDGVKGTLQAHLNRFTGLLDAIVKFITATIVVSATFPLFAPLLLLASIPSFIAWQRTRKTTWPYYVEKRSLLVRVTQYIKTLLSSDSTSKEAAIFNTGPILLSKIKSLQKKYYTDFKKVVNPRMFELMFAKLFQLIAFAYTQFLNLASVLKGTLGVGQFTLVFQQTMNLAFSAEEILNLYSSISVRTKYLDKFFEFMNTPRAIKSPSKPISIPKSPTPPQIEFKNVSFRYPGTDRDILKDFNLTINSGEKIALVGENGAGKTTIIKLVLRFYDVSEGEILINGINIKKINLNKWCLLVGALFQDFIKYQFTFKENVIFGNINDQNNKKLLNEAVKRAGADSYLKNLPGKYKQTVGKMFEGGIDLSGGQWQKLALARAFYRNAPILILDEPTSAIDAKAEYEIFERVQKLEKDKTVVIISHRFSTVRNADRILVLSDGKIIEEGNHQQLMKNNKLYAELFNIQAKGYK
jgi:ATP-binding cassette subfamily B protein